MSIDISTLAGSSGLLATGGAGPTRAAGSSFDASAMGLGKDDFFKLFLAQLKNQDPSNPVSDRDFIAQLAQFTLLEAMQQMKQAMAGAQLAQSASLIGRHVEGVAPDGTPIRGEVERVLQLDGRVELVVGGMRLPLDSVSYVAPLEETSEGDGAAAAG